MKKIIIFLVLICASSGLFIACDTDVEALDIQQTSPNWPDKGEE
jgi:hypothetical protein